MTKRILSLLLAVLMVLGLAACGAQNQEEADGGATRTITDMRGREVEIPEKIDSIVCTGCMSLRLVSYLDALDYVVGVEELEQGEHGADKDYSHVYGETFDTLPVIGQGGGIRYTAYPEELVTLAPDVIITTYDDDSLEQLASETGIPVIGINYDATIFLGDGFYKSLRFLGDLLGKEERCEEILAFVDDCKEDLTARAAAVPDGDKPTAYIGAVTNAGGHGIAGTFENFEPFVAAGARNVVDEAMDATEGVREEKGYEVDLEKVAQWDPDVIFLDPSNLDIVQDEYEKMPDFFNSLSAVKNDQVYSLPTYYSYHTNVTYCLMDAYYVGMVLYPEQFQDVDIREKGNEILTLFLGEAYFDDMAVEGLVFDKLTLGE